MNQTKKNFNNFNNISTLTTSHSPSIIVRCDIQNVRFNSFGSEAVLTTLLEVVSKVRSMFSVTFMLVSHIRILRCDKVRIKKS